MRSFPLRRDLGLQVLALSVLFVGLVVAATLLFENLAGQRLEADVEAADLALARAIAQETNIAMDSALQAVRQLGQQESVINADTAGMEPLFRTALNVRSDVNLIYRLDADGIMLFHYPVGPESTVGVDFSFRDYFEQALTTRDPLVSKGRISPTTSQPVATAVMPLWNSNGQYLGLVGTNLKLQSLSHTLAGIVRDYQPDEQPEIMIVDAAGQIIAHPDPALLLRQVGDIAPGIVDQLTTRRAGTLIANAPNGEELLYSSVPISRVDWAVVVGRPTAVAFATPSLFQRAALLSVLIFLGGGILFWLALSRTFVRPLARLTAFSQSIGKNEVLPAEEQRALAITAGRPDQIGHLTRSMQRMQQSIEARLNELSTLLQTSAAVVSSLELQTVLDRILEEVQRLLGVHMCAIFVLEPKEGAFHIQASRGLAAWYAEQTVIDRGEHNSVTMRAIRSGSPIQISDTETNPSFKTRRERARAAGYRSVLAIPLNVQFAPPSALLIFRPDAHVFSEREVSLLTSFANHAAMAIENATLYRHSDMRLQEQTKRLEVLIQSMHDGLVLEDLHGNILYANRRIEALSGLAAEEIIGNPSARLLDAILTQAEDREAASSALARAEDAETNRRAEFALTHDEKTRYIRATIFDVTDADGMPIGRGRILRDITERRRLDRMRSSLISTVSHELRTPLAGIKGYASTLLADDVEWDEVSEREFLQIISDEADRLSELVNDLLDMSRIEAGNLTVSRHRCELSELVTRAAQRVHPDPGARLRVILPASLPSLYVDPQRIEVVLRNLIENAVKYGEEGAPIWVRARAENGQVVVSVEDEGPGIPREHSGHVFESFYRAESGLTQTRAGAGLGLAIAHGFVRAHGGQIWIDDGVRGAKVSFSLPLLQIAKEASSAPL